jgi:hypothetical protein
MSSIEDKIRNLELSPVLPSSFKNGKRENNEEEDDNDNEPPQKKRRKNSGGDEKIKHGSAKIVCNGSPFDELNLKDDEKWKSFSGKEARTNLPNWGKCKMCPKYHIRLVCFDECPDKESHVGKDKVSKEKKDEMVACKKSKRRIAGPVEDLPTLQRCQKGQE